ncbi:hypothetical protein vBAbaPP1_171 [Acinetobacter phage vB_AbaM_P1]|nr:hypothetical protein vBAbaPP1_171 [Acinetobacter phage vB_AbaM_P1]WAX22653.1 hypothetical protein [Acinetobacter phage vB_AbaP_HB01]
MKFDLDDKAKVSANMSNGNIYKIVEINLAHNIYLVECVEYYGPEDIGDGIMIYGLDHQVWVAAYCFDWMTQKL